MKKLLLILLSFAFISGAFGQSSALSVTKATGAIVGPISPTTFKSINTIANLSGSTSQSFGASTIELGAATDTTLARSGAGAVTVEGVQVILSGAAGGTPSSLTLTNATGLPESGVTSLVSDLALKAPLASPTFTGTVTLPSGQALIAPALGTVASASLADSLTYVHSLTAVPNATGGWTEFFCSSSGNDFTTTNLTATDITGMVTTTLTASAHYEFEIVCQILNAADTTGVKVAIGATGTGTAATVFSNNMFASNSVTGVSTGGINAINTLSSAFLVYSSGEGIWYSKGYFTASSTGTCVMSAQIAKVTSNTATVRKGSVLRIRKANL